MEGTKLTGNRHVPAGQKTFMIEVRRPPYPVRMQHASVGFKNARSDHQSLYCTVRTVLYYTVLYYTVLYCAVLYYTVMCCIVLCCTILYCIVLYYTVLYCTVL